MGNEEIFGLRGKIDRGKDQKFLNQVLGVATQITTDFFLPRFKLHGGEFVYFTSKVVEGLLRKSESFGPSYGKLANSFEVAQEINNRAENRRRAIEEGLQGEKQEEAKRKFTSIERMAHMATSYWVQLNNGNGLVKPSQLTEEQTIKMENHVKWLERSWLKEYCLRSRLPQN